MRFIVSTSRLAALLKGDQMGLFGPGPLFGAKAHVHQHMRRDAHGHLAIVHEHERAKAPAKPPSTTKATVAAAIDVLTREVARFRAKRPGEVGNVSLSRLGELATRHAAHLAPEQVALLQATQPPLVAGVSGLKAPRPMTAAMRAQVATALAPLGVTIEGGAGGYRAVARPVENKPEVEPLSTHQPEPEPEPEPVTPEPAEGPSWSEISAFHGDHGEALQSHWERMVTHALELGTNNRVSEREKASLHPMAVEAYQRAQEILTEPTQPYGVDRSALQVTKGAEKAQEAINDNWRDTQSAYMSLGAVDTEGYRGHDRDYLERTLDRYAEDRKEKYLAVHEAYKKAAATITALRQSGGPHVSLAMDQLMRGVPPLSFQTRHTVPGFLAGLGNALIADRADTTILKKAAKVAALYSHQLPSLPQVIAKTAPNVLATYNLPIEALPFVIGAAVARMGHRPNPTTTQWRQTLHDAALALGGQQKIYTNTWEGR